MSWRPRGKVQTAQVRLEPSIQRRRFHGQNAAPRSESVLPNLALSSLLLQPLQLPCLRGASRDLQPPFQTFLPTRLVRETVQPLSPGLSQVSCPRSRRTLYARRQLGVLRAGDRRYRLIQRPKRRAAVTRRKRLKTGRHRG